MPYEDLLQLDMLITPSKSPRVLPEGGMQMKSIALRRLPFNSVTPVKDLLKVTGVGQVCGAPKSLDDSCAMLPERLQKRVNSTLRSSEKKLCRFPMELSSIIPERSSSSSNTKLLDALFYKPMESPAKVFAQMKARVQNIKCLANNNNNNAGRPAGAPVSPRKRLPECDSQPLYFPYDVEALTLSPTMTPRKGQMFQSKDTVKHSWPLSSTPQTTCNVTPPKDLLPRHAETPIACAMEDTHMQSVAVPAKNQNAFFAVPEIPAHRLHFPGARSGSSHNSPAKIFAQMKEMAGLRRQQVEVNQVTSTVEARMNCFPVSHKPTSLVPNQVMYGKGSESEQSQLEEQDPNVDVSSSVNATSITSSLSRGLEETHTIVNGEPTTKTHAQWSPPSPDSLSDLVTDDVFQNSPRISIPKKKPVVFQKQGMSVPKRLLEKNCNERGIELRDWTLKMVNVGLFVDGMRVDNKMAWHSNIIAERVTSNVLKTVSGSTYVLVGKMIKNHDTSLPAWFLKKFLFGFPEMWRDYLKEYLLQVESEKRQEAPEAKKPLETVKKTPSSQKSRQHKDKEKPSKSRKTNAPETPVSSNTSLLGSAKVSRSGRTIKPPLEFWKGGRVILDSDMNVTVHEGYSSTSHMIYNTDASDKKTARRSPTVEREGSQSTGRRGRGIDELGSSQSVSEEESQPERKVLQNKRSRKRETQSKNRELSRKALKSIHAIGLDSEVNGSMRLRPRDVKRRPQGSSNEDEKVVKMVKASSRHLSHPTRHQDLKADRKSASNNDYRVTRAMTNTSKGSHTWRKNLTRRISDSDGDANDPSPPPRSHQRNVLVDSSQEETSQDQCQDNQEASCESDLDVFTFPRKPNGKPNRIDATKTGKTQQGNSTRARVGSAPQVKRKNHCTNARMKKGERKLSQEATSSEYTSQSNSEDDVGNGKGRRARRNKSAKSVVQQAQEEANKDQWSEEELEKLRHAVSSLPKHKKGFWVDVAMMVVTRSAEECQEQHSQQQQHLKSKSRKKAASAKEQPVMAPVPITAKVGTLKRKQQIRNFLEHMPKDNHDDVMSSSPLQSKRVKLPTLSSNLEDDVFENLEQNPQTPSSAVFPLVKTPQCLHISPGMLGSVNRKDSDRLAFQLQKKMGKGWANIRVQPSSSQQYKCTPLPSHKSVRRISHGKSESPVVWKMFSDKDPLPHPSDDSEEEDYYFMDDD